MPKKNKTGPPRGSGGRRDGSGGGKVEQPGKEQEQRQEGRKVNANSQSHTT